VDRHRTLPRIFEKNRQNGTVVIELIVASVIFAVVFAAFSFYFIFHLGTMKGGQAQMKLQRIGSLVMEEMAQAIRSGQRTDLDVEGATYTDIMITYPDTNTRCFRFETNDIKGGPDYDNLTPLEALENSQTVGSVVLTHRIVCDDLRFIRQGNTVAVRFTLRHDLDNSDVTDDLAISFGSAVKLRG
jgi:hypothetical protein